MPNTLQDVPLFGAEDLHQIERVNDEIDRHGRAGLKNQPQHPLFADVDDDDDGDDWSISYGGTKVGTARI